MATRKPQPAIGPTVGADKAFPDPGPDVSADGTYEQEAIEKGAGTMPLQATPPQPVTATSDLFVRLPSGVLVQYRKGDRLTAAHVGLPTVPGVVDARGV